MLKRTTDRQREDLRLPVVVLAVAATAWLVLSVGGGHHSAATVTGHHHPTQIGTMLFDPVATQWLGTAGQRATGWALMIVAMMLPASIPLLRVIGRLAEDARERRQLIGVTAASFTAVWIVAGISYLLVDLAARALVADLTWLHQHPGVPAGMVALIAAGWQLSPAKDACLTACRSPVGLTINRWGRRTPLLDAGGIGAQYALVCIGCCWALMALGLVVGVAALPLMLALSVVMAAERMVPAVRPLTPLVALGCAGLGVALLTDTITPGWLV